MRWPWQAAAEARSAPDATGNFTSRALAAAAMAASDGRDPRTAAVETCAGLFGRCLAAATIDPAGGPAEAMTADFLAWAGRRLVTHGEALFAIAVEGGAVRLLPAASHDVSGRDPDPATWRYRLDLPAPGGTTSRSVEAAGTIHLRWHTAVAEPWRGVGPLEGARVSADLHEKAVRSLRDEAGRASGGLLPIPMDRLDLDQYRDLRDAYRTELENYRAKNAMVPGVGTPESPLKDVWQVRRYGPEPDQWQVAMANDSAASILSCCGISPALFAESGDGSGQREAWRRFWIASVAPLGATIERELQTKLDPGATVTFDALRASDEDGRSRAAARRAAAWKIFRDGNLNDGEARRLAGLET